MIVLVRLTVVLTNTDWFAIVLTVGTRYVIVTGVVAVTAGPPLFVAVTCATYVLLNGYTCVIVRPNPIPLLSPKSHVYDTLLPTLIVAVRNVTRPSVVVLLFVAVNTPTGTSTTSIVTPATSATMPRASVTVRLNVNTVGVCGAVNVGVKYVVVDTAALNVTTVPPVCFHACVTAKPSGLLTTLVSATVVLTNTVWFAFVVATGWM